MDSRMYAFNHLKKMDSILSKLDTLDEKLKLISIQLTEIKAKID